MALLQMSPVDMTELDDFKQEVESLQDLTSSIRAELSDTVNSISPKVLTLGNMVLPLDSMVEALVAQQFYNQVNQGSEDQVNARKERSENEAQARVLRQADFMDERTQRQQARSMERAMYIQAMGAAMRGMTMNISNAAEENAKTAQQSPAAFPTIRADPSRPATVQQMAPEPASGN